MALDVLPFEIENHPCGTLATLHHSFIQRVYVCVGVSSVFGMFLPFEDQQQQQQHHFNIIEQQGKNTSEILFSSESATRNTLNHRAPV